MKRGYLNMTNAAKYAGVSRTQIYRWLEEGLPTNLKGGLRLVKISELDEWIEAKPGRPNTRREYMR